LIDGGAAFADGRKQQPLRIGACTAAAQRKDQLFGTVELVVVLVTVIVAET
jgi:hypothetical protein